MNRDRLTRVNELLRREIAELLFSVLSGEDVDVGAITVTRVTASRNLRSARVMVSIRDHQDERSAMLSMLKRHRAEIQGRINKDLTLKYTPRLEFFLDESLEKGDRILGVLSELGMSLDPLDNSTVADIPPGEGDSDAL